MRDAQQEQAVEKTNAKVGEFLAALTRGRGTQGLSEGKITRITIRMPTEDDPGILVVVKASAEGVDHVGFIGGWDVPMAVMAWRARDGKQGLKWRVDKPWDGRR